MFSVFLPKGPLGARGPPGPPGKSGEDVRIHLCFYKHFSESTFVHKSCKDFFPCCLTCLGNTLFPDSQGNNGRPGKPGDRGAPGPQVKDALQIKENETNRYKTDIWTVNVKHVSVICLFWIAGRSWIPRNPWTPRNEGTQSECWYFPLLDRNFICVVYLITWSPLAWSKQKLL